MVHPLLQPIPSRSHCMSEMMTHIPGSMLNDACPRAHPPYASPSLTESPLKAATTMMHRTISV